VAGGDRHRRRHPDPRLHPPNAHALGRYAALCQAAQIVEPEVLMDGGILARYFNIVHYTKMPRQTDR
jgi:fructose-bisphosphate aldolase class 1